MRVELHINGEKVSLEVDAAETLLVTLRDRLKMGGTHEGCGIGLCGACTVLVEGDPICGCLLLTAQADGRAVTTIEGLSADGGLHPIQQAFIDEAGYQCAFCTSGFVLSTVALLDEQPNPDDEAIREYLSGNLCRCGTYGNILKAVRLAAERKAQI